MNAELVFKRSWVIHLLMEGNERLLCYQCLISVVVFLTKLTNETRENQDGIYSLRRYAVRVPIDLFSPLGVAAVAKIVVRWSLVYREMLQWDDTAAHFTAADVYRAQIAV